MKLKTVKNTAKSISMLVALSSLTACGNTLDRLSEIGAPPPMQTIQNPVQQANYAPLTWPAPIEPAVHKGGANSLWQAGARSFFKDQRANRVGDILTVLIEIDDKADLTNKTAKTRTTTENLAATNFLGLEEKVGKVIGGNPDLSSLLNLNGSNDHQGDGTIGREEEIKVELAAIVTQVLPNGNMVIHGTQEARVNYEVRQITIDGVIRPQDISSDNTVSGEQIAEARISYGGRGALSDIQQPRIGTQVIDILSPF